MMVGAFLYLPEWRGWEGVSKGLLTVCTVVNGHYLVGNSAEYLNRGADSL